jgi:predicted NAD/FAD-dependent oxidoreductase
LDTVVVGAGVAGLACAAELQSAGRRVVLVDKGRGVGGRCATRRVDGQPIDHGVPFLHGEDETLAEAVRAASPDGFLDGWPDRIVGAGRPCMRRAFHAAEWRGAIAEGINAFPKALAAGLDVRSGARVETIHLAAGSIDLATDAGERLSGREVVVTLPAPQTADLLDTVEGSPSDVRAAVAVLRLVSMSRCLTVLAVYDGGVPVPEADLWLPEDSDALLQVVHDSAKRKAGAHRALVLQARPSWSKRHWDDPVETWSRALLDDAAHRIGRWVASPRAVDVQRWRYARGDGASEFGGPMLLQAGGTGMMGIAGEAFSPGGGVQGAWRSGREIARRMIEEGS